MQINSLYEVLVIALAVAAISMTIAKGKIFDSLRERVEARSNWFGSLLSCPYCVSHWVAFGLVFIYQPVLVSSRVWVIDLFVSAFVVISIAALVIGLMARALRAPETNAEIERLLDVVQRARSALVDTTQRLKNVTE